MYPEHVVAGGLARHRHQFEALLRASILAHVTQSSTRDLLTLTVSGASSQPPCGPAATRKYAKLLSRYVGRDPDITSGIDNAVVEAVFGPCQQLLEWCDADGELATLAATSVAADKRFTTSVLKEVARDLGVRPGTLRRYIRKAVGRISLRSGFDGSGPVRRRLALVGTQGAIALLVVHAMATMTVKSAFLKATGHAATGVAMKNVAVLTAKKVGINVALKNAVAVGVKKTGVSVALKGIFVKAGIAVGAGALTAALLVPIIAAFMLWEWDTFPNKLGKKMAATLPGQLAADNSTLYQELASEIVAGIRRAIREQWTAESRQIAAEMSDARGGERLREFIARLQRGDEGLQLHRDEKSWWQRLREWFTIR